MRQQVVVEQNQLLPALQERVEVAHLARRAFLDRHHAKGAAPWAAARQKAQGAIPQFWVKRVIRGQTGRK